MDQRTEPIRQDIDSIRDSMTDKIEQIETKIKGTVDDTRRMVDIRYQVSQRPWAALGVSLLVGYTIGSIGSGSESHTQPQRGEPFRYYDPSHDDRARASREYEADMRHSSFTSRADTQRAAQPGMLDQIMEQFGDEFELLKAAAITSVINLVRDAVRENLPGVNQELRRLRSEQDGNSTTAAARTNTTAQTSSRNDSSRYYDTA